MATPVRRGRSILAGLPVKLWVGEGLGGGTLNSRKLLDDACRGDDATERDIGGIRGEQADGRRPVVPGLPGQSEEPFCSGPLVESVERAASHCLSHHEESRMFRGPGLVRFALSLVASALLTAAPTFAASPAETVERHLAAGEFGRAADVAAEAEDFELQAQLLEQVASAQEQAGAQPAARATLRRIAAEDNRGRAQGHAAQQQALAGGGSFADFFSLINLIQQNTEGMWEDIDGTGGTATPFETGVRVSPFAMLRAATTQDSTGKVAGIVRQARKAELNDDLARSAGLRFVSLKRLEQEVAARLDQGLPIPESMAQLGGLTQVQYVAIDEQERDILIGGPAEAWQYSATGQPVGLASGRPTLQLDDFVVVLRTFARGEADFGCSINTRDAGVKALQDYAAASQARGPLSAGSVRNWVKQLQAKLGKQDIVVWGVPADSRVARVIVEADYRMKLIGIDKLDAGKTIPSYFDLLASANSKNPPAMEALRWWLRMKYDAVLHSPDRTAFEIQGSSVRCLSENQMLTEEGKHLPTGQSEPTNRQFAENFTNHYADLAKRDLVFADMQNIFDLALVAALMRQEQLLDRSGWQPGVFASRGNYRPAKHVVPKEIDSVVNHRVYNGRDIVVQVAGGVRGDVLAVVNDAEISKEARVAAPKTAPALPAGRWWWDAAK
jgi:hypothetical protein